MAAASELGSSPALVEKQGALRVAEVWSWILQELDPAGPFRRLSIARAAAADMTHTEQQQTHSFACCANAPAPLCSAAMLDPTSWPHSSMMRSSRICTAGRKTERVLLGVEGSSWVSSVMRSSRICTLVHWAERRTSRFEHASQQDAQQPDLHSGTLGGAQDQLV